MRSKFRSHLTYANMTATIAVFLALGGGVAWALGTNSVRSKHIVNGQVKSVDAANNGLTGVDVNEATLGQVPNAANAANANTLDGFNSTAFAQTGSEAWHELAPGDFNACWLNTAEPGRNTAGYYRDPSGVVHLKGHVNRQGTDGCGRVIFTLPAGYRPLGDENQVVSSAVRDSGVHGLATITIVRSNADPYSGQVTSVETNSMDGLFLDGITFRCAPSGTNGCP